MPARSSPTTQMPRKVRVATRSSEESRAPGSAGLDVRRGVGARLHDDAVHAGLLGASKRELGLAQHVERIRGAALGSATPALIVPATVRLTTPSALWPALAGWATDTSRLAASTARRTALR